MLCRFDPAFYGHDSVTIALAGGAQVSVTVRMDPAVKRAIAEIPEAAWKMIEYTDAVFDKTTSTWVSKAEVPETGFTAFTSHKKAQQVTGRLVVRRIPELNRKASDGQETLFDTHRHHAFFTTVDPGSWTPSRRTKRIANTPSLSKRGRQSGMPETKNRRPTADRWIKA